jgi:hypothetical protein
MATSSFVHSRLREAEREVDSAQDDLVALLDLTANGTPDDDAVREALERLRVAHARYLAARTGNDSLPRLVS